MQICQRYSQHYTKQHWHRKCVTLCTRVCLCITFSLILIFWFLFLSRRPAKWMAKGQPPAPLLCIGTLLPSLRAHTHTQKEKETGREGQTGLKICRMRQSGEVTVHDRHAETETHVHSFVYIPRAHKSNPRLNTRPLACHTAFKEAEVRATRQKRALNFTPAA